MAAVINSDSLQRNKDGNMTSLTSLQSTVYVYFLYHVWHHTHQIRPLSVNL